MATEVNSNTMCVHTSAKFSSNDSSSLPTVVLASGEDGTAAVQAGSYLELYQKHPNGMIPSVAQTGCLRSFISMSSTTSLVADINVVERPMRRPFLPSARLRLVRETSHDVPLEILFSSWLSGS
jgi:hypothetical protein